MLNNTINLLIIETLEQQTRETHTQRPKKINIWTSILRNHVIDALEYTEQQLEYTEQHNQSFNHREIGAKTRFVEKWVSISARWRTYTLYSSSLSRKLDWWREAYRMTCQIFSSENKSKVYVTCSALLQLTTKNCWKTSMNSSRNGFKISAIAVRLYYCIVNIFKIS